MPGRYAVTTCRTRILRSAHHATFPGYCHIKVLFQNQQGIENMGEQDPSQPAHYPGGSVKGVTVPYRPFLRRYECHERHLYGVKRTGVGIVM